MVITDDCLAWVLNEVGSEVFSNPIPIPVKGEHIIAVDSSVLGKTCGILPVGVASARLTLRGFEWNLGKRSMIPSCLSKLMHTERLSGRGQRVII